MRVAVISDIHSNIAALDAVLAAIGSVDAIWHLGDLVGYGPEPDAVVERMRGIGTIGVRGNHDDGVVTGDTSGFNSAGAAAAAWTRARIAAPTAEYLAALPLTLVPEGSPFTLVHGMPSEPLVLYLTTREDAAETLADVATAHCLFGHTHVPVAFREGPGGVMKAATMTDGSRIRLGEERCVLNPGSVGQPRDGDPRAAWMVLDTDAGSVTWRRVRYAVEKTQRGILGAGLPPFLAERLAMGQ